MSVVIKCTRCKVDRTAAEFAIWKNDRLYKWCIPCRGVYNKTYICVHKIQKADCKSCRNPIKITITNWIKNSKISDKKYLRYDIANFIDKAFCKNLIEDYKECAYCNISLQYIEYSDSLATIERLDNRFGHIKSNCVLACMKCNKTRPGRVGSRSTTPEIEPLTIADLRIVV